MNRSMHGWAGGILFSLVITLTLGGCQSAGDVAEAGGLVILAELADQLGEVTDRELALLAGARLELTAELQAATDADHKAAIAKLIEKNDKTARDLEVANAAVDVGGQAAKTDWKDPSQSVPWIPALIATAVAAYTKRESMRASTTLGAFRLNLADYMAKAPPGTAADLDVAMSRHRKV